MLLHANWNQRNVERSLALGPDRSFRIAKTAGYLRERDAAETRPQYLGSQRIRTNMSLPECKHRYWHFIPLRNTGGYADSTAPVG